MQMIPAWLHRTFLLIRRCRRQKTSSKGTWNEACQLKRRRTGQSMVGSQRTTNAIRIRSFFVDEI
jgi:hypothetical protein